MAPPAPSRRPRRVLGGGGRARVAARLAGAAHHPARSSSRCCSRASRHWCSCRSTSSSASPCGAAAGCSRRRAALLVAAHLALVIPAARCDVGAGLGGRSAPADDPQRQPLRRRTRRRMRRRRRSSPPMSTCSCSSRSRATCSSARGAPASSSASRTTSATSSTSGREAWRGSTPGCRSSPARSSRSPIGLPAAPSVAVGDTSVDVLAVHVSDPTPRRRRVARRVGGRRTRSPTARPCRRCSPATSTPPAGTRSMPTLLGDGVVDAVERGGRGLTFSWPIGRFLPFPVMRLDHALGNACGRRWPTGTSPCREAITAA